MDQLKEIIDCVNINQAGFKRKLNNFRIVKIKILLIEQFPEQRLKLKGFLTRINLRYSIKELSYLP